MTVHSWASICYDARQEAKMAKCWIGSGTLFGEEKKKRKKKEEVVVAAAS